MLEHHQAAYCVMSGARLPCVLRATAPFAYVRMHGSRQRPPLCRLDYLRVRRLVVGARHANGTATGKEVRLFQQ